MTRPIIARQGAGKRIDIPMAMLYRAVDGGFAHFQPFYDFSGLLLKTGALKIVSAAGEE